MTQLPHVSRTSCAQTLALSCPPHERETMRMGDPCTTLTACRAVHTNAIEILEPRNGCFSFLMVRFLIVTRFY